MRPKHVNHFIDDKNIYLYTKNGDDDDDMVCTLHLFARLVSNINQPNDGVRPHAKNRFILITLSNETHIYI